MKIRESTILSISIGVFFVYLGNKIYEWSLEGRKDIDWTHRHIKTFGVEIFLSSILYFIGFFTLLNQIINNFNNNNYENNDNNKNNRIIGTDYKCVKDNSNNIKLNIKISNLLLRFINDGNGITVTSFIFCFFTTFYQTTKDTSATLMNHGQYNLLVLSGFLLLYTLTFLTWWFLLKYFKIKKILFSILVLIIFITLLFNINHFRIKKDFLVGIDGKILIHLNNSNPNVCKIENDFIVWPAFQPTGSTWVVAGSRECPLEKGFSYLDEKNYLHIDCKNKVEISYTTSPTFFEEQRSYGIFTDDLKILEKQYKKKKYQYNGPILISDETVMATCGNKTEIHFQNVLKKSSLERASNFNEPKLSSFENKIKKMNSAERTKPVDILFILIDALSRAHFKRALPKTFETLQAIQNEGHSKVFQFFRYHSLKPYSDPNYIALYTGYNSLEYDKLDREIIPEKIQNSNNGEPFSFEKNPLFFQSFRNDSYITSWIYPTCEDWFDAYLKVEKPNIDHELVLPFCSPQVFPLERPFGIFEGPYSIRRRCLGNKHIHDRIFDYINQIFDNYSKVGKIVSAGLMDAHEGTMEVIKIADKQFNRFLGQDLKSKLNDTVLILVGDHGQHMGPYYSWTKGGSIEVAFPVLYIILPTWFTNKYPNVEKNLLENENRLFSPFQLYDTIRALSKYPEFGGIDVFDPNNIKSSNGLLDPIPEDISCSDLAIPHSFCKCL
ncbi:hypothetical protein DICPUDRAFT_99127 [Dictyostelium purpureum]|uniref:Uncharacterized protein n=1 Tax=Dictyostelium purpureum TaxID=5786 RepID=F0ZWH5_DICPU|nr:uncharacterized protein DICPUDRAFT_99127 [Dictyostelium purpureum]EGC31699.1 hypothetical protein DICPUDRAFT_99127 [Dictyostelium purpureum]|eukprot:XP_003291765.1 hypothetical protein DICPUDRAFT_99127 [Dictyostelium purpureum]